MFLLTVILESTPQLLQFHYDERHKADHALDKLDEPSSKIEIVDDYGSRALIITKGIAGIFVTDLDREIDASEIVEAEKMKSQMRVQKKVQEAAPKITNPFNKSN